MDILFNFETDDKFQTAIEDIIKHLCNEQNNSTEILDEAVLTMVKEEINDLILKSNGDSQWIEEILLSKGFKKERITLFSSYIEKKQNQLMYLALVNYNSVYGETIKDFDWVLKLIYGTSELKKLNYPLLQLAFTTVNKNKTKQRMYDVSEDMLQKIINVLENIDTTD